MATGADRETAMCRDNQAVAATVCACTWFTREAAERSWKLDRAGLRPLFQQERTYEGKWQ